MLHVIVCNSFYFIHQILNTMAEILRKRLNTFKAASSSVVDIKNAWILTQNTSKLDQDHCDCVKECHPKSCSNAKNFIQCSQMCEKCNNRWFTKVDSSKFFQPFVPGHKELGIGIQAKCDIKQGQIVGEYVGEFRSYDEYKILREARYAQDPHFYALTVQSKSKDSSNGETIPEIVLDATRRANLSKFVNHCKLRPNLEFEIWRVDGIPRAYFRALHDIPKGTELTYNYGMKDWDPKVCFCSNCLPNENAKQFIPTQELPREILVRKSTRIETKQTNRPKNTTLIAAPSSETQTDIISSTDSESVLHLKSPDPTVILPEANLEAQSKIEIAKKVCQILFVCEICDKTFGNRSNLKRHKRMHSRENWPSIKCATCEVTFTENNSLKRHIKTVHADQPELFDKIDKVAKSRKKYPCTLCVSRFTRIKALKHHEKTKHK
ncbi:unnamed protein product [Orchesella dallaii]|uniref:Histone-lysine N-methyltransferase PRDM9 n=1 Tax=Orchesella dallaii TaxID=48710 RepID=A0ABP1RLS6_9HEXA